MHLAASAIRLGEINQALVLGASAMVNPVQTLSFSKLGVLSPTGSSKSFDAAADGYARAEGFAAVLIKRLDLALKDGDHIYSVITGSAINANGKGKSLTMPEGEAQGMTIRAAYARANRNPADAFYVELHATGTLVGDPIEVNGAGKVFSKGRDSKKTLRVGPVKANMGHAGGCSFMASLIKVSLMLHNKEIILNIRFTKPNPKIDFSSTTAAPLPLHPIRLGLSDSPSMSAYITTGSPGSDTANSQLVWKQSANLPDPDLLKHLYDISFFAYTRAPAFTL